MATKRLWKRYYATVVVAGGAESCWLQRLFPFAMTGTAESETLVEIVVIVYQLLTKIENYLGSTTTKKMRDSRRVESRRAAVFVTVVGSENYFGVVQGWWK